MSDLIIRELLVKEIVNRPTEQSGYNPVYLNGCATRQNEIIDIINDMPTVEAVPVVHGEWVNEYINRYGHPCHCCSVCGFHASHQDKNFCPECGADMRKRV